MTATATEAPMFKMIPIGSIRPSPQNPRKKIGDLAELTASIKSKGILQPLLVRPVGETTYELVAGERRWTASKAAQLEEVPCMVRTMTAEHALELALVENVERNDLSPMEEARAFELLQKAYKRTVDDVASKVGRSLGYVRQRLRLTKLTTAFAKMLDDELLDVGGALVVAQFSAETQDKIERAFYATERRTSEGWVSRKKGERITRAEVLGAIESFTHRLAEAPFLTTDAGLVSAAGACTTCPKHTGRQGDLYDVTEQTDTCLDDACWSDKARAQFDVRAAEHKKRGLPVLSDAEAKKVLQHGRVAYEAEKRFTPVDAATHIGEKRKLVAELVGEDAPRTIAFDVSTGRTVELFDAKQANAAIAAARKEHEARAKSRKKNAEPTKADEGAAREAAEHKRRKALYERRRLVACAAADGQVKSGRVSLDKALRVVIAHVVNAENAKVVVKRRELPVPEDDKKATRDPQSLAVLNAAATSTDPKNLIRLLCELIVATAIPVSPYHSSNETPEELVGLGLDLKSLGKLAGDELARAEREKKSAKKAATAKAPSKKAA